MKKRFLLMLAVVLTTLTASADIVYDFKVDGFFYNVLSEDELTCEVTFEKFDKYGRRSAPYSGNVVIPTSVDYNGKTYSVTAIGEWAFFDCRGLKSVVISNSVTEIKSSAFAGCNYLLSVEIGNSVTTIGNYAFSDCTRLTSIEIPSSVNTIGSGAFSSCDRLTSIEMPNSVNTIGAQAFYNCINLTSVEIGNSVTSIGDYAFRACKFTSIVIPSSVTSIGNYAFQNCTSLKEITSLMITPTSSYYDPFDRVDKETCVLKVPVESVELYKRGNWGKFKNIVGIEVPTGINSIANAATSGKTYGINGAIAAEGQKGIVIRDGKKILVK